MAREAKTVETKPGAGKDLTFTSFLMANGGQYDNTEGTAHLVWNNTTAGIITVTLSTDKLVSPQAVATTSATFAVPANAVAFEMPVLLSQWWAQEGTQTIYLDTSADGLDWAAVRPA